MEKDILRIIQGNVKWYVQIKKEILKRHFLKARTLLTFYNKDYNSSRRCKSSKCIHILQQSFN